MAVWDRALPGGKHKHQLQEQPQTTPPVAPSQLISDSREGFLSEKSLSCTGPEEHDAAVRYIQTRARAEVVVFALLGLRYAALTSELLRFVVSLQYRKLSYCA